MPIAEARVKAANFLRKEGWKALSNLVSVDNSKNNLVGLVLLSVLEALLRTTKDPEELEKHQKTYKELHTLRKRILELRVEESLGQYTEEFVLGALIHSMRYSESDVHHREEHLTAVSKISVMAKSPSVDWKTKKFAENALRENQELQNWLLAKAEDYMKPVEAIINRLEEGKALDPRKVIEILRENVDSDRLVLFILAASIKSNPFLHQDLAQRCNEKDLDFSSVLRLFGEAVHALEDLTQDPWTERSARLYKNAIANSQF